MSHEAHPNLQASLLPNSPPTKLHHFHETPQPSQKSAEMLKGSTCLRRPEPILKVKDERNSARLQNWERSIDILIVHRPTEEHGSIRSRQSCQSSLRERHPRPSGRHEAKAAGMMNSTRPESRQKVQRTAQNPDLQRKMQEQSGQRLNQERPGWHKSLQEIKRELLTIRQVSSLKCQLQQSVRSHIPDVSCLLFNLCFVFSPLRCAKRNKTHRIDICGIDNRFKQPKHHLFSQRTPAISIK